MSTWTGLGHIKGGPLFSQIGSKLLSAAFISIMVAISALIWNYFRAEEQDRRANLMQLQTFLADAEKLYCEQAANGYTHQIKRSLDRAHQLVLSVEHQLLPIDYLTLASVGSEVWDQALALKYASRAVQICEEQAKSGGSFNVNSDDIYASYLTRGHLKFRVHCESDSKELLGEAQKDFDQARDAKKGYSARSKQLRGEAWLKQGELELYCGREHDANTCFENAKQECSELTERISLAHKKVKCGIRPQVECPSQLTLTPSLALHGDDLVPNDVDVAPIPPRVTETGKREQDDELLNVAKRLLETMNQLLVSGVVAKENVLPVRPKENSIVVGGKGREPKSSVYHAKFEFNLVNNLKTFETVQIEGVNKLYRLRPGQRVHFTVNYGDIVLIRSSKGKRVEFPKKIFWDEINERPVVPLIEITGCCFREIAPGAIQRAGQSI